MNDLVEKIKEVEASSLSDAEKLQQFVNFMVSLKPVDNSAALVLACTYGISSAQRLGRSEMEAQFYITRAKVFIMQTGTLIHEMKNITLAPHWFQFALESEKKRYAELDMQVKKIWSDVQADIEKAFEAINKNRIAGAVAFVLKTTGEVYGQYYLQLRLYCFKSKSPFHARLANMKIFRWIGADDFFVLSKEARGKLKTVKNDCLTNLYKAIALFKQHKNYDYLADALLALSTEYRSFQSPIRSRFYLTQAERLIKKHKLTELEGNLALMKRWEPFSNYNPKNFMDINRLVEANTAFRRFEKELSGFSVSDNKANKFMSLLLSSLESFELVSTRYANIRNKIQDIHKEEWAQRKANPERKSWPAHPDEKYSYAAVRVDAESLFIFGIIMVRRTLPLIELFILDKPPAKTFEDLSNFYSWISTTPNPSKLTADLRNDFGHHFRWLYAVLRFYRNRFVEHLSEPRQQGMNFDLGGKKFALHSYKWNFNANDEKAILDFKNKLEKRGITIPNEHNPRHYVQLVFDNLDQVPEDFLQDALRLIDDIGIDSPSPTTLINHIEAYLRDLFNFMSDRIGDSHLAQYRK